MKSKNLHVGSSQVAQEAVGEAQPGTIAKQPRAWLCWIPAVLWAGAIFTVSSIPGDTLPLLPPRVTDKGAHTLVYLVLGVFVAFGFRRGAALSHKISFLATIAATAIYGASDEFHQRFVPKRSPELLDWAADVTGGFLGAVLALVVLRLRERAKSRAASSGPSQE